MKKGKQLFDQTVSDLVTAYISNELRHGECSACAVGNILKRFAKDLLIPNYSIWSCLFVTKTSFGKQTQLIAKSDNEYIRHGLTIEKISLTEEYLTPSSRFNAMVNKACANRLIEASGYTMEELARVELAFETAPVGESDDEWMFNGLMAVVDVLADINGISLEEREESKLMFVR
jgi:hypothetical protein